LLPVAREYVVKGEHQGFTREFDHILLKDNSIVESVKSETAGFEKGKLSPTDLGSVVNKFLVQYFHNIIDYNFTASVEKEFDEISRGHKKWNEMIDKFYGPFHFHIKEIEEKTKKFSGERLLGQDPKTGKNVFVKIGRYGPVVQIGETESEEKPRFAGLKKSQRLESVTLEEALELFNFPRTIGSYEDNELTVAIGRYGPYIKHKNQFYSLAKTDNPSSVSQERAIVIILEKRKQDLEKIIQKFDENEKLLVLKGRYGPYISDGEKNYRIPKSTDPASLTLEQCMEIIESQKKKPKKNVPSAKKKS